MKRLFTICFMLLAGSLLAQTSGGPDAFGYTWKNSNDVAGPAYTWYDISLLPNVQTVTGLSDDNTQGPFLLPTGMNFHYYWYDIDKFWIGSNGYVIFTNGQISSPFPSMPATTLPNDIVAVMMSDLTFTDIASNPVAGATCQYWTSAGLDTLIVSWITVPFWQNAAPGHVGANSFQIVFSTVDSSITYNYKQQVGITQNNDLAVGIENNSGVIGLNPINNPLTTPYVNPNFSIKFYPPANSTFVVHDATSTWANNPTNGALFISKGGAAFSMNSEAKNVGNIDLPAFTVNAKVTGPVPSNAIKAQDNVTVGPLVTGQSEAVNMIDTFDPLNAGTYRYFAVTGYSGDDFLGNDSAKVELIVVDSTAQSIRLSYDNGIHSGDATGLSWSGGNGGAGIYIIPPYYPCEIDTLRYFIVSNPNSMGFTAAILDDDGPGGAGGTELFSEVVVSTDVDTLAWNYVYLSPPVTITDGGFYISWMMNGDGISLGQDRVPPFSNRTFEVLGSTWAIYRYRETEDLMMNATMKGNFGAGQNTSFQKDMDAELYPNPSSNIMYLSMKNLSTPIQVEIFDAKGSLVNSENYVSNGSNLSIDISALPLGIYTLKAIKSDGVVVKRFTVQR